MHYIVKAGETPQQIAQRFGKGSDWQLLVLLNSGLGLRQVGKESGSGRIVYTFAAPQQGGKYRANVRLVVPTSWLTKRTRAMAGVVGGSGGGGGGGQGGDGGTSSGGGTPCNIGLDCADGELCDMATHTCRTAKSGEIATGGTRDCNSSKVIKDVQNALLANGQKLPDHGADGSWGPESQAALDASGMPFEYWAQGCDGPSPASSKKKDGPSPQPTCQSAESVCTADANCCEGLTCQSGKCAPKAAPGGDGSLTWLWITLGTIAGVAVVGTAIYVGTKDDDKKKGSEKKAAAG